MPDRITYTDPARLTENHLHRLFFATLSNVLQLKGAPVPVPTASYKERPWLPVALEQTVAFANKAGALLARGENVPFGLGFRLIASLRTPKTPHQSYGDYLAFRRAVLSISCDLFLLTRPRSGLTVVPQDEWRYVARSAHFRISDWLQEYLGSPYRLLSDTAVREVITKELSVLQSGNGTFSDRADQYIGLCALATQHALYGSARELLRKCVECVLAYGWHKDLSLHFLIQAIEALTRHNPEFVKEAIGRLFPAVSLIDEITDGDETSHTKFMLADLMLDHAPHSFVAYFGNLLKQSEWYEADSVLGKLLARAPVTPTVMTLVASAMWEQSRVDLLRRGNADEKPAANRLISANEEFFGELARERADTSDHSTGSDSGQRVAVVDYPPRALGQLVSDLDASQVYGAKERAVSDWFAHWKRRDGPGVLEALSNLLKEQDPPWPFERLLDPAFELSLALEGPRKAYRWLVAAQIHSGGWDPFTSDKAARARFEVVAAHYRDSWAQFIIDTARSRYAWITDRFLVPTHRLVEYLVIVGQVEEATRVAGAMLDVFESEVSEQKIPRPDWFSGN